MFCAYCGGEINDKAVVCIKCGCSVNPSGAWKTPFDPHASERNGLTTLFLCFFLGYLGIHSFYAGKTGIGLAQLFTLGGCGIWVLIDLIMIVTESFKDVEGKVVRL